MGWRKEHDVEYWHCYTNTHLHQYVLNPITALLNCESPRIHQASIILLCLSERWKNSYYIRKFNATIFYHLFFFLYHQDFVQSLCRLGSASFMLRV